MILDSTGYLAAAEYRLAIGQIELAINKYQEVKNLPSVDDRLEAADFLFKATKDAWALLHANQPDIPALGPIGIA